MTKKERIEKARADIDFLWRQTQYWIKNDRSDSETAKIWRARWVAACDMYEVLIGHRYDGE